MKPLCILFLLIPLFTFGQVPDNVSNDLHVQVYGDTVYLGQSMAVRNCGADYDMRVILAGDTLYWYQVDTGATAVCLCSFNLSVTVDSVPAGHYTAMVYYTACPDCPPPGPDTVYVGSVEFDVTEQNAFSSIRLVDQDQSQCFPYNGTGEEKGRVPAFSVFPDPVQNRLHLVTTDPGEKTIRIVDLQNRCLGQWNVEGFSADLDLSNCRSGIYILCYSNGSMTYHSKFVKE